MDKARLFLVRRYAQAFLDLVYDDISFSVIEDFKRAVNFFETHKEICFLMDLPLLSAELKEQALYAIIEKFNLPIASKKLFFLLIAHKRSKLLGQVLNCFVDLYKERAHITSFLVESSCELSDNQKKDIEHFLKEQIQATVVCSYQINAHLIAGVRMSNEKYIWEHSAQAQLRVLHTSVSY